MNIFTATTSFAFIADGLTPEISIRLLGLPANSTNIPYGLDSPDAIIIDNFDGLSPSGITATVNKFIVRVVFLSTPSSGSHSIAFHLNWNLG